ncbi:MAG TPA: hypothetical protein PKC43_03710 [Phycisphaerales bacterium]|nr:hypothetical protein [Phycisphaerales bacterium]HMP36533.1 hypothetical protein [Phycisphaerales bacterium]
MTAPPPMHDPARAATEQDFEAAESGGSAEPCALSRRGQILRLAQRELGRGVRRRRIRRRIAQGATIFIVIAGGALVWSGRAERDAGVRDGAESHRTARARAEGGVDVGSAGAPDRDRDAKDGTATLLPSPSPEGPEPSRVSVAVVRQSRPSPGAIAIIDDRELVALLRSLDEPLGAVVIGGRTHLVRGGAADLEAVP